MSIHCRKHGERLYLSDNISITVLGIDHCEVKLGVRAETNGHDSAASDGDLSNIRSEGARYFLFPQGGHRTLVVRCEKGKSDPSQHLSVRGKNDDCRKTSNTQPVGEFAVAISIQVQGNITVGDRPSDQVIGPARFVPPGELVQA